VEGGWKESTFLTLCPLSLKQKIVKS